MSTTQKGMPYVRLGNSGLKVSKIILGTAQYGTSEWQDWIIGEEEAVIHIKAAYDAGVNTFDTADSYSNGLSEVILGNAIKKLNLPRDEIVVMTKISNVVGRSPGEKVFNSAVHTDQLGYVNQRGLSRKYIFASIKKSLERLQLDYVDVLHCHRFDTETSIEETMQALHDVVQAGHVRYIGMSSCWAYQCTFDIYFVYISDLNASSVQAMQNYAIANHLTPFISMQNHHSLIYREEEREMFPTLKMFGVGCIPWSPLARGLLTRPLQVGEQTIRRKTDPAINLYVQHESDKDIINRLEQVAEQKGASMAQIALAWSMAQDIVTAPIVGPMSLKHLQDLLGAVDITLTAKELKYLEESYKPKCVIGHI
ncbi:aryl-alcohol dehydrogenase [Suillus clintonianus]|uniref:aryl-alcohol dehydrogenase n=1 Tax=Suillus clintonianus TaxID=1904413 RepID=UPI001B8647E1|nr:aryl-alcohol dehydrogenase [Suillus clintonianus]KAG2129735.1 aryl-alcohol dehydrogenase [Suillus clintonianus]